MMMNLFSMFDPSIMVFKTGWLMIITPIFILAINSKPLIKAKYLFVISSMKTPLEKEVKALTNPIYKKGSNNMLLNLFTMLLIINVMALGPFNFTPSAHISFSFTLATSMWLMAMVFGWKNNFKNMMAHMVPLGTPTQLMNFMVLIEMVSNLIRPITLSVRLSANMVAGHLLMSLLANFCLISSKMMTMSFSMLVLTMLEVGVAFIQAYVFMTLITLYSSETH